MKLMCDLFGHWPSLFSLRRRDSRWTCRCWLCESRLTRERNGWIAPAG